MIKSCPSHRMLVLMFCTQLFSCVSNLEQEKEKVLSELLKDQQENAMSVEQADAAPRPPSTPADGVSEAPADEVSEAPADEVSEAPADEVSEAPADEVSETPADEVSEPPKLPPSPPQPSNLNLPLPRGVAHADLLHFVNANSGIMQSYMPLSQEWRKFSRLFSGASSVSPDELLLYRGRVRENAARAHWLFVWGIYQTSQSLLSGKRSLNLIVDRQQDFVTRMRTLVFLMSELELAGMKAGYRPYLREFYKGMSAKYFKRRLKDRPAKPRGPLQFR